MKSHVCFSDHVTLIDLRVEDLLHFAGCLRCTLLARSFTNHNQPDILDALEILSPEAGLDEDLATSCIVIIWIA